MRTETIFFWYSIDSSNSSQCLAHNKYFVELRRMGAWRVDGRKELYGKWVEAE